jgi:hypothetical protein
MKTSQSPKAVGSHSDALQIRQDYAAGIAYDYVLDVPVSVYQYTDLAMNLVRCFAELARKLLRDDLARGDSPLVELFEAVNLIWLESL